MIPHRTFCVGPSMFDRSFSHRSFSFTNIVFSASWTAYFVYYIGFAQQRGFVLRRCKVPELRCLEEGFDLNLLLRVQECHHLLPQGFDEIFSSGTDVRHVEPQRYYFRILFSFSLPVGCRVHKLVDQTITDVSRDAIPGSKFLHLTNTFLEMFTIAQSFRSIHQRSEPRNTVIPWNEAAEVGIMTGEGFFPVYFQTIGCNFKV